MTDLNDQRPLLRRYTNPARLWFWTGFSWGCGFTTIVFVVVAVLLKL